MIVRKFMSVAAAAALALSPTVATAQQSMHAQGSPVRASASLSDANSLSGSSTPVFLGLILVVLFGLVVISDNGDDPNNTPASP